MSTERKELFDTILTKLRLPLGDYASAAAAFATDAVLAAGYRKPQVITTIEGLIALPGQAVIRDSREHVFEVELHETERRNFWASQHWTGYGGDFGYKAEDVTLPVTVIFIPEGQS